ncbi:MAG: DUF480 domain-containing protein [Nostocoides sp.]
MPEVPVLDPAEQRVLGSLLEKQVTVPASYPLSLNSLRTACNQSNSRDPVVDYDEAFIEATARGLKQRDLVRVVWGSTGQRALKYHQRLDEHLDLAADERSLMTVLLLRGPQSPGELRTRTERLHAFADRETVEACLRRLAERSTPLVGELGLRPGQQDHRWVHLLGPVEIADEIMAASPVVARDVVLADGAAARDARVRAAYDVVASSYAAELGDELDHKPFDMWLLDRVAELAGADPVVEVGCGPGQVAARLAAAGADVTGIDLSSAMVTEARVRVPAATFEVGDFAALMRPARATGWGAVVAWYALVHLAGSELGPVIAGLARPIRPGGWLALALHVGDEVRHTTEFLGHEVDLDFVLHDPAEVLAAVRGSGVEVIESYRRSPLAGREVQTERLYVLGRTPE